MPLIFPHFSKIDWGEEMIGFTSKPSKDIPVNRLAELFVQEELKLDESLLSEDVRQQFYLDQSIFDETFEYRLGYWRGISAAAETVFGDEFRKAYLNTEYFKTHFPSEEELEAEWKRLHEKEKAK